MDTRMMDVFAHEMEKAAAAQYLMMGELAKSAGWLGNLFSKDKRLLKRLGGEAGLDSMALKSLKERAGKTYGTLNNPLSSVGNMDDLVTSQIKRPGMQAKIEQAYGKTDARGNWLTDSKGKPISTGELDALTKRLSTTEGNLRTQSAKSLEDINKWKGRTMGVGAAGLGLGAGGYMMGNKDQSSGTSMPQMFFGGGR